MGRIVGIDLGTTTSEISYIKNGRPEIIKNGYVSITPSLVALDKDMNILVGQKAKNCLAKEPKNVVKEVKRLMGTNEAVYISNMKMTPVEISALILKELKTLGDQFLQDTITEAVITVPANFNDAQRQATVEAGKRAGLNIKRIINEPTAAALAYGIDHTDKEGKILVYDLGGGTFDVSILEMIDGAVDVIVSRGISRLGGADFDRVLTNEIIESIKRDYETDLSNDLKAFSKIELKAEQAKIELSSSDEVNVELGFMFMKDGEPICPEMLITREKYESLISGYVKQSMDKVIETLNDAGLTKDDIDIVLAVGGSSRTPMVLNSLSKLFPGKIRGGINPDEAVSLGAAIQAGLLSGEVDHETVTIFDVCNHSLGIDVVRDTNKGLQSGFFDRIILRDSHLPASRTVRYSPVEDYQTEIQIDVYQGEENLVKDNTKIGEMLLEGIPANKAGDEKVDISFKYNIDGILEVSALIVSTGKKAETSINMLKYDAPKKQGNATLEDLKRLGYSFAEDIQTTINLYKKRRDELPEKTKNWADKVYRQLVDAISRKDRQKIEELDSVLTDIVMGISLEEPSERQDEIQIEDLSFENGFFVDGIQATVNLYKEKRPILPEDVKNRADKVYEQIKEAISKKDRHKVEELDNVLAGIIMEVSSGDRIVL